METTKDNICNPSKQKAWSDQRRKTFKRNLTWLPLPPKQRKTKILYKTFLQTRSHATEMRANGILPDVWTRNGSKTSTSPQAIWIQPYAAGQFYSLEALHPDSLSATKHQSWNREKKDPCIISIYPIKVIEKEKLFSGDRNPHLFVTIS